MNVQEKVDNIRKVHLLWDRCDIVLDRYNRKEVSEKTMLQSMKYLSRQINDMEKKHP